MTDWNDIAKRLSEFGIVEQEKRLAELTSFGVGGEARIVVEPFDENNLLECMKIIWGENLRYYVFGKGTNLLVSDKGFDGIIVRIYGSLNKIEKIDGSLWRWESGALLKSAIEKCIDSGFGGIEELAGIPGSIGGATIMNASAYGISLFDKVRSVEILSRENIIEQLDVDELKPTYRGIKIPDAAIVLSTYITLDKVEPTLAREKVMEYMNLRAKNQPIDKKSAGCIFKNPKGLFAGKLIEDAGLKGLCINDAMVSPVHSNFIVNNGKASAEDIMRLIEIVKEKVFAKFSVELELEVKTLGF